jgi:molecular chaperone DnaK (HSP70)
MAMNDYGIGIDLGTANTCTAILQNGKVGIIPHDGESLMPSYVAFTENGRLIGSAAKSQAASNPTNTVFGALRLLGKDMSDQVVQDMNRYLPFSVQEKSGRPAFSVCYKDEELLLTPQEILAMLLTRVKRDIQDHVDPNCRMTGVVITIPAHFDSQQRQAILDAAFIAELSPHRLISSGVAACLDYTWTQPLTEDNNILVIDLGAGFVDVVAASISVDVVVASNYECVVEIIAVGSHDFNVGEETDSKLFSLVTKEFAKQRGYDPTVAPRARCRLRRACETAKRELSSQERTRIDIDQWSNGQDFACSLTRENVRWCCIEPFQDVIELVDSVLRQTWLDKSKIQVSVLAGGFSRQPFFQTSLSQYMEGGRISRHLHPDEAAARGAALHSAAYYDSHRRGVMTSDKFPLNIAHPWLRIDEHTLHLPLSDGTIALKESKKSRYAREATARDIETGPELQVRHSHSDRQNERRKTTSSPITDKSANENVSARRRTKDLGTHYARETSRDGNRAIRRSGKVPALTSSPYNDDHSHRIEAFAQRTLPSKIVQSIRDRPGLGPVHSGSDGSDPRGDRKEPTQRRSLGTDATPGLKYDSDGYPVITTPLHDNIQTKYEKRFTEKDHTVSKAASSSDQLQTDQLPETLNALQPPSLLKPTASRPATPGMHELFSKPEGDYTKYTDADFIHMSTYLQNTGRSSWGTVPRLYTVLRLISQLDMLDTFIEQGT